MYGHFAVAARVAAYQQKGFLKYITLPLPTG